MTIIVLKTSCTPHDATSYHPAVIAADRIISRPIQCHISFLPSYSINIDALDGFVEYKQSLRPCGMDNVIIIEADEEAVSSSDTFVMSLTNCHVTSSDNRTYYVDVVPTTLRFPISKDAGEIGNLEGGFFTPMEGSLVFDFTMALEVIRRDSEKLNSLRTSDTENVNNTATECRFESTTSPNKHVDSILIKLDQETQFLKSALAALGIFCAVIVVAFVWTAYQLTLRKKRRVRIVDTLPREIEQFSLGRDEYEEMSPLRQRMAHETLHLVSLRETPVIDGSESLRHWYEDFLSPRLGAWKAREEVLAAERDVASRFLFSETKDDGQDVDTVNTIEPKYSDAPVVENNSGVLVVEEQVTQADDNATEPVSHEGNEDVLLVESKSSVPSERVSDMPKIEQDQLLMQSYLSEPQADSHQENVSAVEVNHSETKLQEHKEVTINIKSSFSSKSNSISILELAEHIETSCTPFHKKSESVMVSPDKIKVLSIDVVPTKDSFLEKINDFEIRDNCEVSKDVQIISEDASPTVTASAQSTYKEATLHDASSPEEVATSVHPISPDRSLNNGNEVNSITDSMSSASLLVSLDSNVAHLEPAGASFGLNLPEKHDSRLQSASPHGDKCELSHELDSISSAPLSVSVDGEDDIVRIFDEHLDNNFELEIESSANDIDSKPQPEEEDAGKTKEEEMSAHNMKQSLIQELKSSSRFKLKKSSAASSFADELAVFTGSKTAAAAPESSDFASCLAKRAAKMKMAGKECKTPMKKAQRKSLKPIDLSPPPQSIITDDSEFLSDYW